MMSRGGNGSCKRSRRTSEGAVEHFDWFSTIATGSEPPADAASELQELGFVILPGPEPTERPDLFASAYDAAIGAVTSDDIRVGSTSTHQGTHAVNGLGVPSFSNRRVAKGVRLRSDSRRGGTRWG